MIKPISQKRWQKAQDAERALHDFEFNQGVDHYRNAYANNFRYLGIDPNTPKKSIVEIGPADFPALRYCYYIENCFIVEPMPSSHLAEFCKQNNVNLITVPFEDDKINLEHSDAEVWLFNVLQHVQDPELFIAKAKQGKIVRYFEPIDTHITDYHPHTFTKEDFDRWFPGVNKFYNETTNAFFHDGPCCYGVWEKSYI